jgi:hypothetical protein
VSDAVAIRVAYDGPVMTVTMDRPDLLNALDPPSHRRLIEAFDRYAADDGLYQLLRRFLCGRRSRPAIRPTRRCFLAMMPKKARGLSWNTESRCGRIDNQFGT